MDTNNKKSGAGDHSEYQLDSHNGGLVVENGHRFKIMPTFEDLSWIGQEISDMYIYIYLYIHIMMDNIE